MQECRCHCRRQLPAHPRARRASRAPGTPAHATTLAHRLDCIHHQIRKELPHLSRIAVDLFHLAVPPDHPNPPSFDLPRIERESFVHEESHLDRSGRSGVPHKAQRLLSQSRHPALTVGCAICYDLRFSYLFQALAEKGADMIALPSAFTLVTGKDHWEVLCRARAIEVQAYICAPAQTGAHKAGHETRFTYGNSLIADPWGHVVAKASEGPGLVSTHIDIERIRKIRSMIPVSKHRVKLPM